MFLISGLFMCLNGALMHKLLNAYSMAYSQLNYKDKHETVGRINCSLYQSYIIYSCLTSNSIDAYIQTSQLFISLMFFDMMHYVLYDDKISNYLHHIITILVVFFITCDSTDTEKVIMCNHLLFLFESTNPLMSISWIANKFGYRDYILFKIFSTITFLYWTNVRILYLSYYIYNTTNFNNQLLMIPFFALNLFWFKPLVTMYLKVIFKKDKAVLETPEKKDLQLVE